jgi:hypothetical protein
MATLNDFLLNEGDIQSLYGVPVPAHIPQGRPQNYLKFLPAPVSAKLRGASPLLATSYIIPKGKYTNVYITSDIHSDLKKLHHLLKETGLVSNVAITEDEIMQAISGELDWIAENTLLVIIGDIVDGVRHDYKSEGGRFVITKLQKHQDDGVGNVELLLMAYLYNLRIKARAKNSEVIFTVGNHDYQTVISDTSATAALDNNYDNNGFLYDMYVHNGAKSFFGSRIARRRCLMPFFETSPFLMVNIGGEIMCVHGGFHVEKEHARHDLDTSIYDISNLIIDAQNNIDSARSYDGLTQENHNFLSYSVNNVKYSSPTISALWTRFYATEEDPDRVCRTLVASPYKFVVVGHCQTKHAASIFDQIIAKPQYGSKRCGQGGCVLIGCELVTGPKLAFVDISMSACFRRGDSLNDRDTEWEREKAFRAEILKLKHDPTLIDTNRFYNVVSREKVSGSGDKESIISWSDLPKPAPAAAAAPNASGTPGGKSRSKRRNRKNRRKTRK